METASRNINFVLLTDLITHQLSFAKLVLNGIVYFITRIENGIFRSVFRGFMCEAETNTGTVNFTYEAKPSTGITGASSGKDFRSKL